MEAAFKMCLLGGENDSESKYHMFVPLPTLHCLFGCYEFPASQILEFLTTQLGLTTSVYTFLVYVGLSLILDPTAPLIL